MVLPESADKRKFSLIHSTENYQMFCTVKAPHNLSPNISGGKKYFPVFLEDEFQYTISPSQTISSVSITLLSSLSEPHLSCLGVYHWDRREHNLKYVRPQQPSHQPLIIEREQVSEMLY
jgi:hypothetical protein